MNQDVAIAKALQSVSDQLGGLSTRQQTVIKEHLYLVYGIGYDAANRLQRTTRSVIRTDSKGKEREFSSVTEAARASSMDRWALTKVLRGDYKQWKGYKFKYKKDEKSMDY